MEFNPSAGFPKVLMIAAGVPARTDLEKFWVRVCEQVASGPMDYVWQRQFASLWEVHTSDSGFYLVRQAGERPANSDQFWVEKLMAEPEVCRHLAEGKITLEQIYTHDYGCTLYYDKYCDIKN